MNISLSKDKLKLLIGLLIFIGLFQWIYISWINPVFGYIGFNYTKPTIEYLIFAWLLAIFPVFWIPTILVRPSQFFYWTIYLTIFIPSVLSIVFMNLDPPFEILTLNTTLVIGFWLMKFSYHLPLIRFNKIKIKTNSFWWIFNAIYFVFNILIFYFFKDNFRFVTYFEIYDLRAVASDLMQGTLIQYPIMWLTAVFNPLLMAYGLNEKKKFVFLIGALDQILLYSTDGAKIRLISIPFVLFVYFCSLDRSKYFRKILWFTILLLFVLMTVSITFGVGNEPTWLFTLLSIVFMRTIGTPGWTTSWYFNFFQTHPYTYFSHVNVINLFIPYPYEKPLGLEIGEHSTGSNFFDANAHFWATDGIAGCGLLGIILISMFAALIFWVMDSMVAEKKLSFILPAMSVSAMQFSNISLFTCLLSGGLIFLIILIYFFPIKGAGQGIQT